MAACWFEYGNALLSKEEDSPTDDLLGAVALEAKNQAQALGQEIGGASEDEDDDEDDEVDDNEDDNADTHGATNGEPSAENNPPDDEEPSDMQIAWEALEV